ncbi:uncharacterized protein LOC124168227 [Ischnura elegans]|uniref:uncharacterized protein LOC124168227 n=1 Tax=Ischnura elegans TaxID=197161 RepID=UPI001ED8AFF6|nr:uncharacterized protein LOC124168227 [Ischnura elegans]
MGRTFISLATRGIFMDIKQKSKTSSEAAARRSLSLSGQEEEALLMSPCGDRDGSNSTALTKGGPSGIPTKVGPTSNPSGEEEGLLSDSSESTLKEMPHTPMTVESDSGASTLGSVASDMRRLFTESKISAKRNKRLRKRERQRAAKAAGGSAPPPAKGCTAGDNVPSRGPERGVVGAETPKAAAKRSRTPGDTPSGEARDNKRVKPSYAEVTKDLKRMAIVPHNYPTGVVTEEWIAEIEGRLEKLWDAVPEGQELPIFMGTRLINGAMEVACCNDLSASWLVTATEQMGPVEGIVCKCVEADTLIKRRRLMVWVPGHSRPEVKPLQERLKRVNPGLNISLWRTYDRQVLAKGTRFILGVDEPSADIISGPNFQRHIGLSKVEVAFLGTAGGTDKPKPPDEEAASTSKEGVEK